MVLDTSAILTILLNEPEAATFVELISKDPKRLLSAGTALELMIVIEARKGEAGGRELDLLLHRTKIDIVPFDNEQAEIARIAWRRFGKSNHPAGLNFGDCFAYALAKISGEQLLFKGKDFNQTDISFIAWE
ncbi:MAG: type II toxin-antitoxin system VapC family toxin [Gammaproteobacteria bacterium]|nr:MAG: type II toxin-antitoxin system VapC family toxin [Gammaproteobacteria bacterium]